MNVETVDFFSLKKMIIAGTLSKAVCQRHIFMSDKDFIKVVLPDEINSIE